MKTTNSNQTSSASPRPRSKHRGFILGLLCLLGLLMAPIQSYAGIRAGFVEAKPMIRTTVVKNGALVEFSAKLMSGPQPVSGVILDVYILPPGKPKERVGRVTTNTRGGFVIGKRIFLSTAQLKLGQASIPWFVEVIQAPRGGLISGTNQNQISGWGFRVVP